MARVEGECLELTGTEGAGRHQEGRAYSGVADSSQPVQLPGVVRMERAPGSPCGRTYSRTVRNAKGRARWAWMQDVTTPR